ncbi:MAG TPA: metal ABC transporter permease [Phototrophicaceae bacterium]|nr:metal ABC transporter permease [Phototrophicaceae bacterium]
MDIIQQIFLEPLNWAFMQRALVAAVLIGIVSGVMGAYVVTRGLAFLGDALAHSILPGVAIAFLTTGSSGASLLFGGLAAGVLSALGIGFLTRGGRMAEDTAIGIVFAGMLALGIGLISRAQNYAVDLTHVLIGNILAVGADDLNLILVIGLLILVVVVLLYKELLVVSFDPVLAQTLLLPGETLRLILLVLLAITIVIGVQVAGVALVAAMLVTPAATARFWVKRMHHLMLVAAGLGAISGVVGLYLAWHLEIAASAAIVLTMTALFGVAFFLTPGKGYLWSLLRRSAHTA